MTEGEPARCLHCGGPTGVNGRRGLCRPCYNTPGVRKLYRRDKRCGGLGREPTEEELDAMIAEQMRPENLPSWWHNDAKDED
jgi:hypothetical protein